MKKYVFAVGAAALALSSVQASAVTGSIPFNGTVTHTCTITVGPAGALTADASFQSLASTNAGGSAGSASVVATGNGFGISVDTATLSKPATDTSSESLASAYSTSGATSTSGSDSDPANGLNNGTTNVSIHMSATKSGSDVFEAGAYTGTVVLRCE